MKIQLIERFKGTRLLILILAAGFAGMFFLSGCGQNTAEQPQQPTDKEVILATTTSTYDTGLLDVLVPDFKDKTGYEVKPVAVGTGQALAMGAEGNADVLLVHAPASEMELVDSGAAINRQQVMHNYFTILGPADDPAGIKGMEDAPAAMEKIADDQALFVSRGDDSGTNKKELEIWDAAGIAPEGAWYIETGTGMGDTLRVASEKSGYTLSDRGTYLALKSTLDLIPCVAGGEMLLNQYSVMQINPEKFEGINVDGAKAFEDYLVSQETQELIQNFGVEDYGEPLFVPDALH